jgi:hypothetical protein
LLRLAARLGAAAVALGATLAAQARLPLPAADERTAPVVVRGELGRLSALGFEALVADYHWLRAVQVVGHEKADLIGAAPILQRLVEAVVELDPFVDHPYRFATLWLTHSPEQVRAANRLLERGVAYHPDDWRNRFYLSFNHFFYLGDVEAAARELAPAVGLPGTPPYLPRLLARLRSEGAGSLEPARVYLEELLRQTEDPFLRAEYEKALDEIATESRARVLDQAREVFRQRHGRDITAVEDLVAGPAPVLREIPPDLHGWGWTIDAKSGRIVSAYYGRRYEVYIHATDRQRRERWAEQERRAAREEGR